MVVSRSSILLSGLVSAYSVSFATRSSATRRLGRALAGIMTQSLMLVSKAMGSQVWRSPTSTGVRVCEMRTVERTMQMVENSSESLKASLVISRASAESAGSNMGTRANAA